MANLNIVTAVIILLLIALLHREPGIGQSSSSLSFSAAPVISYYPPWWPEKNPKNSPWIWLEKKSPEKEVSSPQQEPQQESEEVSASQQTESSGILPEQRVKMMKNMQRFSADRQRGVSEYSVVYIYENE